MKKQISYLLAAVLIMSTAVMGGCANETADPGIPPEEIVSPRDKTSNGNTDTKTDTGTGTDAAADTTAAEEEDFGDLIKNVLSVQIGKKGKINYGVTIYDNDAANAMVSYITDSSVLFPSYTYDDEQGFVAQSVRGEYTRDDEVTVTEVHAGELFLFSGNQLRLYFKDEENVDITATPIGFLTPADSITDAVHDAYEDNKGDTWGVEVYFIISK